MARKAKPTEQASNQARRTLGRARDDGAASFPVAPPKAESPDGYGEVLASIKARIHSSRIRAVLAANAELIGLYWEVGQLILRDRPRSAGALR